MSVLNFGSNSTIVKIRCDAVREVKKGGGSFSIQKFMLQIFAIIDDTLVMNFRKNLQYDFPKNEGGGSKTVWNFSENSSVLEGVGFPNQIDAILNQPILLLILSFLILTENSGGISEWCQNSLAPGSRRRIMNLTSG